MGLSRSDLHRVLGAESKVRAPLTPGIILGGLSSVEVEWVCHARKWVPDMARQLLDTQRELQVERRRRVQAEARLAALRDVA